MWIFKSELDKSEAWIAGKYREYNKLKVKDSFMHWLTLESKKDRSEIVVKILKEELRKKKQRHERTQEGV